VGDLVASLNVLLARKGRPTQSVAAMRPYAGQGSYSLLKAAFNGGYSAAELRRLSDEYIAIYQKHLNDKTTLFPDALAAIEGVQRRKMKWGIVTNKMEHLSVPILKKLSLYERADCLVYGDTTAQRKPHPEPLLHGAQQLDLSPPRCAYLGDSLNDVRAAAAAGMRALAVSYGYRPPEIAIAEWGAEAIFDSLSELEGWLDGLASSATIVE